MGPSNLIKQVILWWLTLHNPLEVVPVSAEVAELTTEEALARGITTFMGIDMRVVPGALVPRAETELLAVTAITTLHDMQGPTRMIDMCCGVGNLAVAVADYVPQCSIWASDLTWPCVEAARHNVRANQQGDRVTVMQGDLFAPLCNQGLEGTIDVIVCNPPYISSKRLAHECADLLIHEPREAFDAGPYGLSIHQRVVREALAFLRPGGWLMFEFGTGQARQVRRLFERTRGYGEVRLIKNAHDIPRVAMARAV